MRDRCFKLQATQARAGEYLALTPLYFADVNDVETGNHRERVVIIKDRDASRPHFGKCDMIGSTNPNHPPAGEFYVKWLERLCVLKSSDLVNHRFASSRGGADEVTISQFASILKVPGNESADEAFIPKQNGAVQTGISVVAQLTIVKRASSPVIRGISGRGRPSYNLSLGNDAV
jgi:hypothetical protein